MDARGGARRREGAGADLAPVARRSPWALAEVMGRVVGPRPSWPVYDPALAADDTVTMVVQVNGKVRDKIEVAAGITEAEAESTARASERVARALNGREVSKTIVRPPKLVNLVVRD